MFVEGIRISGVMDEEHWGQGQNNSDKAPLCSVNEGI